MPARNQYLSTLLDRYLKEGKPQKDLLLDEYCRMAFGLPRVRKKRRAYYGGEVRAALELFWKIFDFPFGQRLAPMVRAELGRLRRAKEVEITERTGGKLLKVSPATIDRLLRPKKQETKDRRRYGWRGSNLISKKIPLRMTDWETDRVGYVEMDLVLHCGVSTDGEYIHSE